MTFLYFVFLLPYLLCVLSVNLVLYLFLLSTLLTHIAISFRCCVLICLNWNLLNCHWVGRTVVCVCVCVCTQWQPPLQQWQQQHQVRTHHCWRAITLALFSSFVAMHLDCSYFVPVLVNLPTTTTISITILSVNYNQQNRHPEYIVCPVLPVEACLPK